MYEKSDPQSKSIAVIDKTIPAVESNSSTKIKTSNLPMWYVNSHKKRMAFDFEIATQYSSYNSNILDVGAAPFILTKALQDSGRHNIWALDYNPQRYQSIIDNFDIKAITCDIEQDKIPFKDNFFDLIIMNEVFKHLRYNQIFSMKNILRVLKPNGIFTLSTPNLKSIRGMWNYIVHSRAAACLTDLFETDQMERGHVREYTVREISEFLEKVGFVMQSVIYRGRTETVLKKLIYNIYPKGRPFFSIIVTKR